MNGRTDDIFVFDTNTIISHLNDGSVALQSGNRFISIITEMEVLAKPNLSSEEEQKIRDFLTTITILPLTDEVKRMAISIRRDGLPRPKLPDAIVAATAVILGAKFVTADDKLNKLVWPAFLAVKPV
jgi:predicted nucleic acid-binding protein